MLVINDLHIGTKRQAGATPASQAGLREYIYAEVDNLLHLANHDHIVVNGDLFDGFSVETADVIRTYGLFMDAVNRGNRLTLIMGNHDASAKGDRVSSFHLLAHFLCASSSKVRVIDHTNGLTCIDEAKRVYAISHCLNQDLFNLEIDKVVEMDGASRVLLLHCNVKNVWAQNSDHSLDLDDQQLGALMRAGWTLVVGHEHQHRTLREGRVVVSGNQIVTSIADVLGSTQKFYTTITDKVEAVPWLDVADIYAEINWTDLDDAPDLPFLRVTGTATAEQAAEVVAAVAKLRQRSDAYVISNAVKIDGVADFEALSEISFDSIAKVDVLALLLEELNEQERETVRGLLG